MSIPLIIRDFRLSFVWIESTVDVVRKKSQTTSDFAFLAQGNLYKEMFETIQARSNPLGLEPPWQRERSQRFWKRFLPGAVLESVGGNQAWDHLVPLRSRLPLAVKNWTNGQLFIEGFYYPHALALSITARCQQVLNLADAIKLAYAIRRSERFTVQTKRQTLNLKLNALAQEALNLMRSAALAPSAARGAQREPFTLFTIVQAEGDSLATEVTANGDIHNGLEAITNWPPNPAAVTLPPLPDVSCLPIRAGTAKGSVVYANQRGRAVWFPGLFTTQDTTLSSLGCYHRNHLFGSIQVDSLGSIVADTAAELRSGTPLSALAREQWTCAKNACAILEAIYVGDKRLTYRSQSLKRQIQQNDLTDLNELRRAFVPGAAALT